MKFPSKPRWFCFACGVLFSLVLIGLSVAVFATLWLDVETVSRYSKVATPVGSDYFSEQFTYSLASVGAYVIPLSVGTNQSTVANVLLDTGSPDTWVYVSTGYGSRSTSFRPFPTESYTARYLGGSAYGYLGHDVLNINSFTWRQTFGAVTRYNIELGHIQGLLGLSRGGCDGRNLCALSNWALNISAVGFYYDPVSWQGIFMAGFINETEYCEPGTSLTWLPQTGTFYWTGTVGMTVNGVSLGDRLVAVFDTGNTFVSMSRRLFDSMNTILMTNRECSNPAISLVISGKLFTIPKAVLLISNSDGACNLRADVLADNRVSDDLLVGATFLVNFYTVFDINNDRMGFCPAKRLSRDRRLEDSNQAISKLLDDPSRRSRSHSNY